MSSPARRGSRLLGLTLAVALAAVTALFSSGVASAHAYLRGSDPANGSTVQALPATVSLDFNETIHNFEPLIVVTGPDGANHATGAASVVGNVVSTAVSPGGPPGSYTVAYRVVSADGHPVEGQVTFTLAAAASSGTASSSSSPAPSTGAGSAATATPPPGGSTTRSTSSTTSRTAVSSSATSSAGSSAVGSSSSAAGSTSPGTSAGAGATDPASTPPVVQGVGSPAVETSTGPDWWIWLAIAIAAVVLVIAGVITLRRPRID